MSLIPYRSREGREIVLYVLETANQPSSFSRRAKDRLRY